MSTIIVGSQSPFPPKLPKNNTAPNVPLSPSAALAMGQEPDHAIAAAVAAVNAAAAVPFEVAAPQAPSAE